MNKIRILQNFTPKTKPLPHQVEAINYITNNNNTALFDEQGLGKTKIVIDGLSDDMKSNKIDGALVVAPLSLVYIWENEIQKHSHLLPIILRGSKKQKKYRFLTGANFYITNYESVISEIETISRFCRGRKIAIVLDEAPRIKNPISKTAISLFRLSPLATKRIIITGTPVANKPQDLWAQFFFLDGGVMMGDNFNEFSSLYNEKNPDLNNNLSKLKEIVNNNSIRRLKNDVLTLPEKEFHSIYVELNKKQQQIYDEIREELRIEISDIDGNRLIDEIDNILKRLLRLSQVASNPSLIDKSYLEDPAKLPALLELIESIIGKNEKAIIWTNYVENIIFLKSKLIHLNPLLIYGDIPTANRVKIVDQFQNSDHNKVLIANPAAAREGLTLTRANNAIYFDRNFNLIDYLQSQDRIHRISQNRKCLIYKIIARNTIDEYIDFIIEYKTKLANYIQGDIKNKEQPDFLLDKKGLLQILGG